MYYQLNIRDTAGNNHLWIEAVSHVPRVGDKISFSRNGPTYKVIDAQWNYWSPSITDIHLRIERQ